MDVTELCLWVTWETGTKWNEGQSVCACIYYYIIINIIMFFCCLFFDPCGQQNMKVKVDAFNHGVQEYGS